MLTVILLFVNGTFKVMINQLVTTYISINFDAGLIKVVETLENFLQQSDNIHLLSVLLTSVCLAGFVLLIIFLSLWALPSLFFRKTKKELPQQPPVSAKTILETELEEELMQELQNYREEKENAKLNEYVMQNETETLRQEQRIPERQEKTPQEKPLVDLDWKKNMPEEPTAEIFAVKEENKQPLRRNLRDLLGMVINMLGRNIDELKISQALMFRCKDDLSEENVLQIVSSIKHFIDLCLSGAFEKVRRIKNLPSDEEALLSLIEGDPAPAMALLEALMDERINKAVNKTNPTHRNTVFREASEYACCFGTLAEMTDIYLSSASFELAVEMSSDNTKAWNRCADTYRQMGMEDKAVWAYKNVLAQTEKNADYQQEANACKFLSQYFYACGDTVQATKLYNQSKNFYDSIGINRPLDRKEIEIIELMDDMQHDKMLASVLYTRSVSHSF